MLPLPLPLPLPEPKPTNDRPDPTPAPDRDPDEGSGAATMRASVYTEYGPPDVVRLVRVARPVPGDSELLIRIRATTVGAVDSAFRRGVPFSARLYSGLRRPRKTVLGGVFVGDVAEVGADVSRFRVGDRIVGTPGAGGAHAEYLLMPEGGLMAPQPEGMSDGEAAGLLEAMNGLHFLRDLAGVRPGQRVLIVGASGAIGTGAVQLAKRFGAEVTAVCSGRNAELVRSLGADRVIDYTREDIAAGDARFDVIFDAVAKSSFGRCRRILAPGGIYLATSFTPWLPLWMAIAPLLAGRRARPGFAGLNLTQEGLDTVLAMAEAGALRTVVDREVPFERIAEAHRYVDTGRKRGNVVVTL